MFCFACQGPGLTPEKAAAADRLLEHTKKLAKQFGWGLPQALYFHGVVFRLLELTDCSNKSLARVLQLVRVITAGTEVSCFTRASWVSACNQKLCNRVVAMNL